MKLTRVDLKNFRCFSAATFDLDAKTVLISGSNGAGKSSLLEALHYLCYLRSFRAASPRDLIQFGSDNFFVKAQFCSALQDDVPQDLQVGFAQKKRLVKLNQKPIGTFKELLYHYRVVTVTEDDLGLIKNGPDVRRQFIDHAALLENADYAQDVRAFKKVLQNRNNLLLRGGGSLDSQELWTRQLWERSRVLWKKRTTLLKKLEKKLNQMLAQTFRDEQLRVKLEYKIKKVDPENKFENFMIQCLHKKLFMQEQRFARSLFGAHLDDISIRFQDKRSKQYASRGQQKLIVFLLKIAKLVVLDHSNAPAVLLLDDFMADFDEIRIEKLVHFIGQLPNQVLFTSPAKKGHFDDQVLQLGAKRVGLSY